MMRLCTLFLSLVLCSLSGCVGLGRLSQLPPELQLKEVAKTDSGSPFAVSRDGALAAAAKEYIELISPDGKLSNIAAIVEGSTTALSFSPNGKMLAAALRAEKGTALRVYSTDGRLLAENKVPEKVTTLAWRTNTQVIATALNIRRFSFGSLLTSTLYAWDISGIPVATTLSSVTIRPQLAALPDALLYDTLNMALSPYGDELAYSAVKDPPMFTPYQAIITRHLESGAEQEVTKTSLDSGGPIYWPDGESLVVGDARAVTRRVTIPDGRESYAWPTQGSYPAISPSGAYLLLDGNLYREGRSLAKFPKDAKGAFLADGSGLAMSYGGKLYLISGLDDKGAPPQAANLPRLLELRKLRSEGLITEKEYRAQRDKLKGSAR